VTSAEPGRLIPSQRVPCEQVGVEPGLGGGDAGAFECRPGRDREVVIGHAQRAEGCGSRGSSGPTSVASFSAWAV
jgi:hypothetical protein